MFPVRVFVLVMISCLFSGAAGVLTEYLLQHEHKPTMQYIGFWEQSIHLYLWGAVVNVLVVLVRDHDHLGAVLSLRGLGPLPIAILGKPSTEQTHTQHVTVLRWSRLTG